MASPEQPSDQAAGSIGLIGTTIERYRIEALIGRGGMGEVYRAVDERLRRKVALKVLRPRGDEPPGVAGGVGRLFREARAAAALSHPNVVVVHDLGEADGVFFIVMEHVAGQPLLAYVGDERVSLARKLRWLVQIASALASAHKAGVLHRDVKPSNVMITEDDTAKVLDFGLAKNLARSAPANGDGPAPSSEFRTQAGRVVGTIRYMAPEQFDGDLDARCDQYSFGVTAYELFAGSFSGHDGGEPPSLDLVVPELPKTAARVVARLIARDPTKRFPSMDDVVTALEDVAAGRPLRVAPSEPPSTASADTVRDPSTSLPVASGRPTQPEVRKPAVAAEAASTLMSREAPSELRKLDVAVLKSTKRNQGPAVESAPPRPHLADATLPSADKVVAQAPSPPRPPAAVAASPPPSPSSSNASSNPASSNPASSKPRTLVAVVWLLVVLVAAAVGISLGARSSQGPSPPPGPAASAP